MILPIMVTLFLGGTELSQAISVKRKSVLVNRTIADLVAQDSQITNAEMTGIFNASAAVIPPYTAGKSEDRRVWRQRRRHRHRHDCLERSPIRPRRVR